VITATDTAARLNAAAMEAGMTVSGDLRVSEKDAAKLLGHAAGYLKNMRQEGRAPKHYTRGVGGGRISYRFHDMAEWIEERREDW
jgi:hypothetical protein